jgi:uncharacterized protein (TIGR02757 family)
MHNPESVQSLKKTLDRFYREYNFKERLRHDPIEFPYRYSGLKDIEVAGFVASSFAYGKVELFKPVIEKTLEAGGRNPATFFACFSLKRDARYLKGINYRFNKEKDIICFAYMLSRVLKRWGSLKNLFYHYYSDGDEDIRNALNGFVNYFLNIDTKPVYGEKTKPRGLIQLLPSPQKGSACKRINLFLRWMVRTKDIDLGIWNKIPPSKLIIPLDTHIARISRCLNLTGRTSSDWKTASEITESLKQLDPDDPLKYDFALCHHGISGMCRGEKSKDACSSCNIISNG